MPEPRDRVVDWVSPTVASIDTHLTILDLQDRYAQIAFYEIANRRRPFCAASGDSITTHYANDVFAPAAGIQWLVRFCREHYECTNWTSSRTMPTIHGLRAGHRLRTATEKRSAVVKQTALLRGARKARSGSTGIEVYLPSWETIRSPRPGRAQSSYRPDQRCKS